MDQTSLFSVVILHYNCEQYLYAAIDSVLMQDYPRIELIVADDATENFNRNKLVSYIQTHRKQNLESFDIYTNSSNIGTVKNLNKAIKRTTGKWLLCFAGDDALYDNSVLSKFAIEMPRLPDAALCAAAQCVMMDESLKKKISDFIDATYAKQLTEQGSAAQFNALMQTPFYGVGSSAFRRADFDRFGYFDETYKLVEDWSYFLQQTRAGRIAIYVDFSALRHREGGISHNGAPSQLFWNDMLTIKEREILPFLHRLSNVHQQQEILAEYDADHQAFEAVYGKRKKKSRIRLALTNPKLFVHKLLWRFCSK